MEQRPNCSFPFHEMNSKLFVPFEIYQVSHTPVTEIDQDPQFHTQSYYIHNTKCDPYLGDSFNDCFSYSK